MATYYSNTYSGRQMRLEVTQSGEYFNWTFYSSGGSSNYYSVYNVHASINGTSIFNYGNKAWTTRAFPCATGSESGSVYIGGSGRNISIDFYGTTFTSSGSGTNNGGTMYYTPPTASFNLNILNPDGSEPYTTGEAGSVEQSVGGGSYSRVYNESASSYNIGTTFNYRNFTPGTGRYLSGVSGLSPNNTSGPWSATLGSSGLTVSFQTAWNTYTISYNANGGSSTPSSQTKTYGQALTLRGSISRNNSTATGYTTTFNGNGGTYTGSSTLTATDTLSYSFNGWKSSASGTTYGASASFNENNTATMTAQWASSRARGSITLPASSTVSRSGYTFKGWNTNSSATTGSTGTYTPTSSTTMYAIWQLNAPTSASISAAGNRTKINVTVSAVGAAISDYTVYYRVNGSSSAYSSLSLGTATTGSITGLQPNTTYQIYVKATNAAGNVDSSAITSKTQPLTPTVSAPTVTTPHPFTPTLQIPAVGDTNAGITNYTLYWCANPNINTYDMALKTTSDGALWARIFYHNVDEGTAMFDSVSEALNTQTANKYSRLYLISDDTTFKGQDNKYEFMLCYPNNTTEYNRWKQSNAPQNIYTGTGQGSTVPGYEAVHIDWSGNSWGGLERNDSSTSSITYTYIDGSVGFSNWWYAIAPIQPYEVGMPGPQYSVWSCVELWVRVGTVTASSQSFGSSSSGDAVNLSEETEYLFWGQATNAGGITTGPGLIYTTPADQAKIYRYNNGVWEHGKTYYKVNGEWVKAKKIYIKVNGEWKINNNGGS